MVRLFSHRIGTANWFTVEMGCYTVVTAARIHCCSTNEDLSSGTRIVTRTWQYLLGLGTRFCEPRAWDAIKYRAVDGWKRFAPRINVVPNGDYRRLVDYTYRILVFDVIIFSDNFIRTSNTNIIYFWGYVICDIAMTNEDLLIQFKKLLYNECIRLYILNLNLFQKLNHYNNIAGRIPLDPLSIYLLISSVSLIWSVA